MMTKEILSELSILGSAATKKVHINHGAEEPLFGVKIGDLKILQKKIKKNHELALELFATGNSDAMYLAGLISEPQKMTKIDLQNWADNASWYMISEYAVAWTASESSFAIELANKWISSKNAKIACTGWCTYSSYICITPNEKIDTNELALLIEHVVKNINDAPDRVRYCMNSFLICIGGYVPELTLRVLKATDVIGQVSVNMGNTACKVPDASDYIRKMIARGTFEKKRKTAKC